MIMDDEDTEVILEGGELYKYLKSQGTTLKDVYSSPMQATEPPIEEFRDTNSTAVPDEVATIINLILNSDLLLEEDASYLFKKFSELAPETQRKIPYKCILPGIILGISSYTYWKFNLGKLLCPAFMFCSSVYLCSQFSNLFSRLKQRKKIKQILSDLKIITTYIRKNIKLVQEEDSLIYSKGKVHQLRNDINMINEHTLGRKKLEIFIICQKLIYTLKTLILLSRNITLEILKRQEWKSLECNDSYIALYSDEQLGIHKYGDEVNEETNLLPYIDVMRNVYLVIQSETLREIGLYLCRFTEVKEIFSLFDVLSNYRSKSREISFKLKKMFNKHFYPSYVPKKNKSVDKNQNYLNNIVKSVSSSLNSLLIDSRSLENYIDENTDILEIDKCQGIGFKLLKMEREISYLVEHIHLSAQQFLKETNYFKQNIPQIHSRSNEKITKIECTVGTSDFSITVKDEVFLGHVEGTENTKNDDDSIEDYRKPADHGILINELKSALITKREEFERREIKALKSPEDIENYKSCVTESSKISNKAKTVNNLFLDQYASSSENDFSDEVRHVSPLDKDIAIKARDFLKSWNKGVTDECFGDEIYDDDD